MKLVISIILVFLICHFTCKTLGDDTCVVTDTSCPCSVAVSGGVCMQHKKDNKCLMAACSEGHKCDCLGYEKCEIKSCSKFTTAAGVIPSTETPFSCQSVQGIATCLTVTGIRNGTHAAEAAKLESSQMVKLINALVIAAQTESLSIQEDKIKIDALIERLDYHNITIAEREEISKQALVVVNSIASAEHEVASLHGSMAHAFDYDRQVYEAKQLAFQHQDQADTLRTELNELSGVSQFDLASSKCTSSRCKSLLSKIEELETKRVASVVKAGEMAQKARDSKASATEIKNKIVKIRADALEALKTTESQAIDIFARMRSAEVASARK